MSTTADQQGRRTAQALIGLPLETLLDGIADRGNPAALDHLEALARRAWLAPPHPLGLSDEERERASEFVVAIAGDPTDPSRPLALVTLGQIGLTSPAVRDAVG